jgi:hypothetical protein
MTVPAWLLAPALLLGGLTGAMAASAVPGL